MMLGTCSEPGRISHIPVQYDYDDYADGLHTDAQCELNPACRSAVCAGTARSLLSLSPTPPETSEIKKEHQTRNSSRTHFMEVSHHILRTG